MTNPGLFGIQTGGIGKFFPPLQKIAEVFVSDGDFTTQQLDLVVAKQFSSLLLVLAARSDAAVNSTNLLMRCNAADAATGANYHSSELFMQGTTVFGSTTAASSTLPIANTAGASAAAGYFGHHVIFVPNFRDSHFVKTFIHVGGTIFNTSANNIDQQFSLGVWPFTDPIDTVSFLLQSSGNFQPGSRATAYGLP